MNMYVVNLRSVHQISLPYISRLASAFSRHKKEKKDEIQLR